MHEAPQLAEVVLDGCAGKADAVPRDHPARGLRDLGAGVLDVLRLVEHHDVILET